jgi:hypothetical protein
MNTQNANVNQTVKNVKGNVNQTTSVSHSVVGNGNVFGEGTVFGNVGGGNNTNVSQTVGNVGGTLIGNVGGHVSQNTNINAFAPGGAFFEAFKPGGMFQQGMKGVPPGGTKITTNNGVSSVSVNGSNPGSISINGNQVSINKHTKSEMSFIIDGDSLVATEGFIFYDMVTNVTIGERVVCRSKKGVEEELDERERKRNKSTDGQN